MEPFRNILLSGEDFLTLDCTVKQLNSMFKQHYQPIMLSGNNVFGENSLDSVKNVRTCIYTDISFIQLLALMCLVYVSYRILQRDLRK